MALGLGKMAKKIGSGARSIVSSENIKKAGQVAGLANSNIGKNGGYKKLLGHAGTGAIAGGLSGAGINTLRGEDAWEGAKTGATLGAIGNAGTRGFKMAANSTGSMKDAAKSFKGQMGVMGGPMQGPATSGPISKRGPMQGPATSGPISKRGPMQGPATSGPVAKFNKVSQSPLQGPATSGRVPKFSTGKERNSGLTKSVGALQTMEKDSNQAKQMMSRR